MDDIEIETIAFEFGSHINATLEKLSNKMETTKGEIIRKALDKLNTIVYNNRKRKGYGR